jgi:hypothetical protein
MTALTRQQLNRALLARQMLLTREKTTALRAIERLVGMQAQQARPPYIGLWSRVEGFQREDLTALLLKRKVVRATLMRATLHLTSAKDFVEFRGTFQPMLTAAMSAVFKDRAKGFDLEELIAVAREYYEERPRTFNDMRALLLKHFPKANERALGYAVRTHLPLVQTPGDSPWAFPAAADFTCADSWLGCPITQEQKPQQLVLRYLAAFGPATAKDVETWSYLSGLGPVMESLRPKLRTFRDEKKRELFDLPNAPRPDADSPAPVRFIADFDNLVLGHSVRTRIVDDAHRPRIVTKNLLVRATILVDGFVAGTWKVERKKAAASLIIEPFAKLPAGARSDLEAEGERLLEFSEPDADRFAVRVAKPA